MLNFKLVYGCGSNVCTISLLHSRKWVIIKKSVKKCNIFLAKKVFCGSFPTFYSFFSTWNGRRNHCSNFKLRALDCIGHNTTTAAATKTIDRIIMKCCNGFSARFSWLADWLNGHLFAGYTPKIYMCLTTCQPFYANALCKCNRRLCTMCHQHSILNRCKCELNIAEVQHIYELSNK